LRTLLVHSNHTTVWYACQVLPNGMTGVCGDSHDERIADEAAPMAGCPLDKVYVLCYYICDGYI